MGKSVVVLASGETQRRALPHLVQPLRAEGIDVPEVRIPSRNRDLTTEVAAQLARATWFDLNGRGHPPDKIVVLVDADGRTPEEAVAALDGLEGRLRDIPVKVLVTAAKWHLEAWFFADGKALREYLGGRNLGSVDASQPDAIHNPKAHLKNLLGRPYTAATEEEIAGRLDPGELRRSPSFAAFEGAIRNGGAPQTATTAAAVVADKGWPGGADAA